MVEVVWHKTSRAQIIVPVNCPMSCKFQATEEEFEEAIFEYVAYNHQQHPRVNTWCNSLDLVISNKFESMIGRCQLRIYSRRCRNCDLFESSRTAQSDELFFNWAIIDILQEQSDPSFGQTFEDTPANFLAIKCSTGKTFQVNTKFFHWYAVALDQTRCYETEHFALQHVTNKAAAIWVKLIPSIPQQTDDVTSDFNNIVVNAKDCGILFILLLGKT